MGWKYVFGQRTVCSDNGVAAAPSVTHLNQLIQPYRFHCFLTDVCYRIIALLYPTDPTKVPKHTHITPKSETTRAQLTRTPTACENPYASKQQAGHANIRVLSTTANARTYARERRRGVSMCSVGVTPFETKRAKPPLPPAETTADLIRFYN